MRVVFVLTMMMAMILHTMVSDRGGVRDRVRFLLFTKQEISQFFREKNWFSNVFMLNNFLNLTIVISNISRRQIVDKRNC